MTAEKANFYGDSQYMRVVGNRAVLYRDYWDCSAGGTPRLEFRTPRTKDGSIDTIAMIRIARRYMGRYDCHINKMLTITDLTGGQEKTCSYSLIAG